MFYSHELLTNNEHGVATIWTISQGTARLFRKITKKDIQGIKVPHACRIITEPDAPLALRLQGHLLFGVSCVFDKQVDYILNDAVKIQSNLQTWQHKSNRHEMDEKAKMVNPEQIMLEDDPSFVPCLRLPNLDQFILGLDAAQSQFTNGDYSQMSAKTKRSSANSSQASNINLLVPSPMCSSNMGFNFEEFPDFSAQTPLNPMEDFNQPQERFMEETSVRILEDGTIQFIEDGDEMTMPDLAGQGQLLPSELPQQSDQPVRPDSQPLKMGDDDIPLRLPNQSSSPPVTREQLASGNIPPPQGPIDQGHVPVQRQRKKRSFELDRTIQVPMSRLRGWDQAYVAIQQDKRNKARAHTSIGESKKNAYQFVFGLGVVLIGRELSLGGAKAAHPFAEYFAGDRLADNVLGIDGKNPSPFRGIKRKTPDGDDVFEQGRNVLPRLDNGGELPIIHGELQQQGEELPLMRGDDSPIEIGREPRSVLSDNPSLPWNRSQPGTGIKPPSIIGSIQAPSSPTANRGSSIQDIEREYSDNVQPAFGSGDLPSPERDFGQQASYRSNSWNMSNAMKVALDKDGLNFLKYLEEVAWVRGVQREGDRHGLYWIGFEDVLQAPDNTKVVAAPAFLHVLALKTKDIIKVEQEGREDMVPFGRISIGIEIDRSQSPLVDDPELRAQERTEHRIPGQVYEDVEMTRKEDPAEDQGNTGERVSSKKHVEEHENIEAPEMVQEPVPVLEDDPMEIDEYVPPHKGGPPAQVESEEEDVVFSDIPEDLKHDPATEIEDQVDTRHDHGSLHRSIEEWTESVQAEPVQEGEIPARRDESVMADSEPMEEDYDSDSSDESVVMVDVFFSSLSQQSGQIGSEDAGQYGLEFDDDELMSDD